MTAAELLHTYRAMFAAAREGRMMILQEDGQLAQWSIVVQKIEERLLAGRCEDADLARLREVADEFRTAKERERLAA